MASSGLTADKTNPDLVYVSGGYALHRIEPVPGHDDARGRFPAQRLAAHPALLRRVHRDPDVDDRIADVHVRALDGQFPDDHAL